MPTDSPSADQTVTIGGEQVLLENVAVFSADVQTAAAQQLVSGLGGAIGSDYRAAGHQLVFVELSGKLSRLNLIPESSTLSQGNVTLKGTYLFDFDSGTHSGLGEGIVPPYDVWWNQQTKTERRLEPASGARIVRLGAVNYNSISYAELLELPYDSAPIDGSVGDGNQLTIGTVFAVRTVAGNYAKAQVISYGYDLQIRWRTYQVVSGYEVLGTGYDQPQDVKVAADEAHAYVTEATGALLRVALANADRAFATVVSSGMTAPHQMVLDEPHNRAYLVERAPAGRLLQVDLATGAQSTLAAELEDATGLLLTQDRAFAYVAEQVAAIGRITRIRLDTGHRDVLVNGLTEPFFLTWTDPGESGILVAERDPANRVSRIDLANLPVTCLPIASVPFRPSSVAVTAPTRLLVCCDDVIAQVDLTASVYSATGPMLLGIGHVPADRITRSTPADPAVDGYADTWDDVGYHFRVKDAPFGGTLPIMFNHTRAYDEGARYYKLLVDGVEPQQSFTDLRWSTSTHSFLAQTTNPGATGFYRVRAGTELWYNHWLGYMLSTAGLSNGLHTITVRLYAAQSDASEIGSEAAGGRSVVVQIDNTVPVVKIDKIFHGIGVNEVGSCGIVQGDSDEFTFQITASDPEQHMGSWSLAALWGENQSAVIDGDSYMAHVSPSRKWDGPSGELVPMVEPQPWHATVGDDKSSRRCAHTFWLTGTSRVIDGWSTLHGATYHKSITLLLNEIV
jgi:hypothetical protein